MKHDERIAECVNNPVVVRRFQARVDRSGDCHVWTGGALPKGPRGYGKVNLGKRGWSAYAHRFAWWLERGPVPDGHQVCHSCDNPLCCNVAHLFIGTAHDNMRDKEAKGRGNHVRGRQVSLAKLTEIQVASLRENFDALNTYQLSKLLGLGYTTVVHAQTGKTWKHV